MNYIKYLITTPPEVFCIAAMMLSFFGLIANHMREGENNTILKGLFFCYEIVFLMAAFICTIVWLATLNLG